MAICSSFTAASQLPVRDWMYRGRSQEASKNVLPNRCAAWVTCGEGVYRRELPTFVCRGVGCPPLAEQINRVWAQALTIPGWPRPFHSCHMFSGALIGCARAAPPLDRCTIACDDDLRSLDSICGELLLWFAVVRGPIICIIEHRSRRVRIARKKYLLRSSEIIAGTGCPGGPQLGPLA
jgi:hypothetical protein